MLPFLITTDHHWPPKAHDVARQRGATGPADYAFLLAKPQHLELLKPYLDKLGSAVAEPVTHAYVDLGRWVARCPFCPSAQVVHPDDPRFLCGGADGCANHPVAGAYVPVVFPPARTRAAVERELVKRINLRDRNFYPAGAARQHGRGAGETVADLRRENKERGL